MLDRAEIEAFVAEFGERSLDDFRSISAITAEVIARLEGADLRVVEAHNPGLRGFDWGAYLRASRYRIVMLLRLLEDLDIRGARVLDQGAFFGNYALSLARAGHTVVASDYYGSGASGLDPWRSLLTDHGIEVRDCGTFDRPLPYEDGSFDLALTMGVVEHIPHTPREHLLELVRCLAPGGTLVVETPNLAYQARRDQLAAGQSIFPPIELQFDAEIPFTGHHREYTPSEVEWMLGRVGLGDVGHRTYDYSWRSLSDLDPTTRAAVEARKDDPARRELILAWGRRT